MTALVPCGARRLGYLGIEWNHAFKGTWKPGARFGEWWRWQLHSHPLDVGSEWTPVPLCVPVSKNYADKKETREKFLYTSDPDCHEKSYPQTCNAVRNTCTLIWAVSPKSYVGESPQAGFYINRRFHNNVLKRQLIGTSHQHNRHVWHSQTSRLD